MYGPLTRMILFQKIVSRNFMRVPRRKKNRASFVRYYVAFGDKFNVAKYYDGSYFTVADFVYNHPYVSRLFIRRDAFQKVRYSDLPVTTGFAYEDWDLNARLRAIGYKFLVAPDTIIFYRQRKGSLLPRIEEISVRMISHNPAFSPAWFVSELDQEKKNIRDWPQFVLKRQQVRQINYSKEIFNSKKMSRYVMERFQIRLRNQPRKNRFGNQLLACS